MKKIGKKLSYFTKIFLVLGMFFSNLTGLSTVFAYEGEDNFDIQFNEENQNILINYLSELEATDEVTITVSEKYTYLDESSDENTATYDVVGSDLLADTGYEVDSQLLFGNFYDGTWNVVVSLFDKTTEEDLGSKQMEQEFSATEGMMFHLLDAEDQEIGQNEEGIYEIDASNEKISVIGLMTPGGLSPSDTFVFDETEYTTDEIFDYFFTSEIDLSGHLYGEYTIPVTFEITKNGEVIDYSKEYKIMYGTYEMNTNKLNESASNVSLSDKYQFEGTEKNGTINVFLSDDMTIADLYNIVSDMVGESENISMVLSNSENEDILAGYTEEVDLQEYLAGFSIDNSTKITLTDEELTITYSASIVGDVNKDNQVNEDDVLALIDQAIGKEEAIKETSDFDKDDNVGTLDVIYLDQMLAGNDTNITKEEVALDTRLDLNSEEISSGDEFTIDYTMTVSDNEVSGFAGNISYDDSALELTNVLVKDAKGNNYEGKFIYLKDKAMVALVEIDDEGNETILPQDYTLLTLTFKALKAGTSSVKIDNAEFFNGNVYYEGDTNATVNVTVNEATDNSLSSLTVAGQTIELQDDVLEYEITVGNDVTAPDVEAIVRNTAASISSIVAPSELVEGENEITIVVTAENGDEKVYTVKVTREAAPKEETTVEPVSYQEQTYTPSSEVEPSTPDDGDDKVLPDDTTKDDNKIMRVIVIILILLAIAGLIYLIFKDDKDDEETKKANKDIDKLKKEDIDKVKVNKNNYNDKAKRKK